MERLEHVEITAEQEVRLKKLFEHLDAEKRGYVTHEDLRRLCNEFGHEMTAERAEELILRADPDKVGRIAYEQFKKAMIVVFAKLIIAILLIGAFQKIDVGQTGFIARADLERLIAEVGVEIKKERLEEMILKCNPGPDGRIAFKEFMGAIVAHLRR
jgi:Ca2+-binding EF-hand superfamily protein